MKRGKSSDIYAIILDVGGVLTIRKDNKHLFETKSWKSFF